MNLGKVLPVHGFENGKIMLIKKFLFVSFFMAGLSLNAWQRTVCNLGTIPVKVRFDGCGWDEHEVLPIKQTQNACANFDTLGCCINGITVKADGYADRTFLLDDYFLNPPLQDFHSTGAGIACQRTVFTLFNDPEHKTFSSLATVANDYYLYGMQENLKKSLETINSGIKTGR